MYRFFDLLIALTGIVFLWPLLLIITCLGLLDTGSPLFLQSRVGKSKKPFTLVKFRTMHKETESVATHLANKSSITKLGGFLRKSKLDELPQLYNVLKGEMSLVGPRPNLFSQTELITERDRRGVYNVRPGITGLAQIHKIDMSTPDYLAEIDQKMIQSFSFMMYFKYIIWTIVGKGFGDRISD